MSHPVDGRRLGKCIHCHISKDVLISQGVWGGPCGVVAYVLDCDIIISKFKLQSCYYIHFQTNILWKGMNSLIPPCYGLNSSTTSLRMALALKKNMNADILLNKEKVGLSRV